MTWSRVRMLITALLSLGAIAIILDGRIVSSPIVSGPIASGKLIITGGVHRYGSEGDSVDRIGLSARTDLPQRRRVVLNVARMLGRPRMWLFRRKRHRMSRWGPVGAWVKVGP
jgi:hypothetical protein